MDQKSELEKPISSPTIMNQLPSIKQLIIESWQLLTKKALKLLFLGLLSSAVYFALFIVGILIIVGFGAMNMSSFSSPEDMLDVLSTPGFLGTTISIVVIWIVALIAVGTALQAGMLILLKDPTEDVSVISYFKKGFSYIIPLLAVSAITALLVFGSFFVFIIPALIVGIFLMYTMYAVVLDNKKGMEAIKMSVGIVSQNFGAIMGRIFILWLLSFVSQILIGSLPHDEASAAMFYILISFVSSFAIGWFGLAYVFKLYEHARAVFDETKPSSMTWMWIVSVLGWIICVMIITGIVSAAGNKDFQKTIEDAVKSEMESEFNSEKDSFQKNMEPEMNREIDFEKDFNFDNSQSL